jgi:ribosomal protein S18 acetylase RimI-like enzyme
LAESYQIVIFVVFKIILGAISISTGVTVMFEIKPLIQLDTPRFHELSAGYTSPAVYKVSKDETDLQTTISLHLQELEIPYKKHWQPDSETNMRYRKVIEQGVSLGAYEGDELVGIAIAEKQAWNRTLWVWEFHIDQNNRGRGLGRQLMDQLAEVGKKIGCRVMVCETQNTNVPAIRFYRKVGFEVGAIDLSYYTNKDVTDFEVAVFMKKFIE